MVGTVKPTTPCGASPWSALPTVTVLPGITCTADARKARPIGRSCVVSSATSPGRYSTRSPTPKTSHAPLTCANNASRPESRSRPLPDTSEPGRCGYPASSAASCTRRTLQTPIEPGSIPNRHQPLDSDRSIQGSEMAHHAEITRRLDMPVYFCEKASPVAEAYKRTHQRAAPAVLPEGHRPERPR